MCEPFPAIYQLPLFEKNLLSKSLQKHNYFFEEKNLVIKFSRNPFEELSPFINEEKYSPSLLPFIDLQCIRSKIFPKKDKFDAKENDSVKDFGSFLNEEKNSNPEKSFEFNEEEIFEKGSFLKDLERHLEEPSFESSDHDIYHPKYTSDGSSDGGDHSYEEGIINGKTFKEKISALNEKMWTFDYEIISAEKTSDKLQATFVIKNNTVLSQILKIQFDNDPLQALKNKTLKEKIMEMNKLKTQKQLGNKIIASNNEKK